CERARIGRGDDGELSRGDAVRVVELQEVAEWNLLDHLPLRAGAADAPVLTVDQRQRNRQRRAGRVDQHRNVAGAIGDLSREFLVKGGGAHAVDTWFEERRDGLCEHVATYGAASQVVERGEIGLR